MKEKWWLGSLANSDLSTLSRLPLLLTLVMERERWREIERIRVWKFSFPDYQFSWFEGNAPSHAIHCHRPSTSTIFIIDLPPPPIDLHHLYQRSTIYWTKPATIGCPEPLSILRHNYRSIFRYLNILYRTSTIEQNPLPSDILAHKPYMQRHRNTNTKA